MKTLLLVVVSILSIVFIVRFIYLLIIAFKQKEYALSIIALVLIVLFLTSIVRWLSIHY